MDSKLIFAIFAILATLGNCVAQDAPDIPKLLKDKALVQRQIDCAMDRGPCDDLGKQIKALIPEAISNNCRRCNELHQKQSKLIIEFMQDNYPMEYREIVQNTLNKMDQKD